VNSKGDRVYVFELRELDIACGTTRVRTGEGMSLLIAFNAAARAWCAVDPFDPPPWIGP
jgi:hypothetical protein